MDKDSTEYFMTKMTQEEFNERVAGKQIQHYSFNHIQPERSKREDSQVEFSKEFIDKQNEISLISMLLG